MSTSVSSVTNHFPSAENGFTTTTAGSVSSGAATVTLNSVAGYSNGEVVALVIDPTDASKKQTFTGIVDTAGVQITSVVWTAGTNQTHALGATVVDYATATHISMMTKGIVVEHNQDGTHDEAIIQSRSADTSPASDDLVLTSDTSAANALKKVTLANLFKNPPVTVSTDSATGWTSSALAAPDTITYNGNRSYDVVFNGVDYTSLVSNGMRLKLTRTVTAPTQCTDLESGSSQYFSVTNAAGLATGTTWTIKAKLKLESYALGVVFSIDDATNILQLYVNANGTVTIGGGTNVAIDLVTSYQSLPLNRWVDVTASITVGTPTGEIRLDDVVVPSFVTNSASTTVTLSGDEEIYIGRNAGGNYFDGKICQVALFNAIISDATLKTYSGQTMTGSETNCEGFWSLNNTLADLSANANTLVAGGGALATATDTPFAGGSVGTTEYGIITANTFSTNTTLTVQVPEGNAIPTSGGVSAVSYSTQKAPYGMPVDSGKWAISSLLKVQTATTSNATFGSFASAGWQIVAPIGAWQINWTLPLFNSSTTRVTFNISPTSITGVALGSEETRYSLAAQSSAAALAYFSHYLTNFENLTAAQTWLVYTQGATTSGGVDADNALAEIRFTPTYL